MAPPMVVAAGVSAAGSLLAGQAAMAAGRYQQTLAERNAAMYEMKADQAYTIGQNNVRRFEEDFDKLQASTEISYLKSGVKLSGTPLNVLAENLSQAEIEIANIEYDASVQSYDFNQQAVMSRMQGELAMFQGRQQRMASFINAAGSLVGAYATQNLIKTQAAQQAELIKQQAINNKTLINSQYAMSRNISDMLSNQNRALSDLGKANSIAFEKRWTGQ